MYGRQREKTTYASAFQAISNFSDAGFRVRHFSFVVSSKKFGHDGIGLFEGREKVARVHTYHLGDGVDRFDLPQFGLKGPVYTIVATAAHVDGEFTGLHRKQRTTGATVFSRFEETVAAMPTATLRRQSSGENADYAIFWPYLIVH